VLFRQLEYLVALSRERHFARAAQACYVSQPALSEAIRKLEEEFDVPLVRRGRKYEGLTPEGERIVVWAQRILADRDSLRDEVDALRTGLSGELRIGSVPTASTAVSLLTEPFCAEHPLVSVQVMCDLRSEDVLQRLQNFEIEAGITYLREAVSEGFQVVPLYRECYVLLISASLAPPWPSGVTWKEASRLPLCLLSPVMQGRRVLDAVFAEARAQAAPQVQTDSVATLFAHVATGRWASIVPHAWLHVFGIPPSMRVVKLVEPARTEGIGLVIAAREPGSVMARALADIARRTDIATILETLPGDASAS
jgi:DNA-binding transcriptional LysR family regulator